MCVRNLFLRENLIIKSSNGTSQLHYLQNKLPYNFSLTKSNQGLKKHRCLHRWKNIENYEGFYRPRKTAEGWQTTVLNSGILTTFFVMLCIANVTCQNCDWPPATVITVNETDPAGTRILKVDSYNGSSVWRYSTPMTWLSDYLNFTFNGTDKIYELSLAKPLDLEEIVAKYNLSETDILSFDIKLHCKTTRELNQDYHIISNAVSEWEPQFNTSSIQITIKETLAPNSTVLILANWATDRDVSPMTREIANYSMLAYTGDPQVDGHRWLRMLILYDGVLILKSGLDYESLPKDKNYLLLGVKVTDHSGKSGTASLTVTVEDDDDLPPDFNFPGCGSPCTVTYSITVSPNITGPVSGIKPAPIHADDGDALNYKVEYHIVNGPLNYEKYIGMNSANGQITILKELGHSGLGSLVLIVEAREVSLKALSKRTTLLITLANRGQEKEDAITRGSDDDTSITIAVIILAVIIGTVLILLVIIIVYFKKKQKKAVHPESSATKINDSLAEMTNIRIIHDQCGIKSTKSSYDLVESKPMIITNEQTETKIMRTTNEYVEITADDHVGTTSIKSADEHINANNVKSSNDHTETESIKSTDYHTERKNIITTNNQANIDSHEAKNDIAKIQNIDCVKIFPRIEDIKNQNSPSIKGSKDTFSQNTSPAVSDSNGDADDKDEDDSSGSDDLRNFQTSGHMADDEEEIVEYFSHALSKISTNGTTASLGTPHIRDGPARQDDYQMETDSTPQLQIVSGLKLEDSPNTSDYQFENLEEDSNVQRVSLSDTPSFNDSSESLTTSQRAPARQRRSRRRSKTPRSLEKIIYDGTKDFKSTEMDSGFYTDSSKIKIKRSSRSLPLIHDPNDTRYWVTVSDF